MSTPMSNGGGGAQGEDRPPPLPPRPERGHTPPPTQVYSNSYVTTSNPPQLMKRQSPVPTSVPHSRGLTLGPGSKRGTSPITTVATPLKASHSMEIQQQFQQLQLHNHSSIFPEGGETAHQPPPPYPMGTHSAGIPNQPTPPPSYSQSILNRQSPTLSTTSSDKYSGQYPHMEFRRSPAPAVMAIPNNNHVMHAAYQMQNGHTPIPTSPSPSASSMMSSSSRTSSTLPHWSSSRQASTACFFL